MTLENEHLSFRWHSDASAEILDRSAGRLWRMCRTALQIENRISADWVWQRTHRDQCEEFAGRFRGAREGQGVRFVLLGRMGEELGSFWCSVNLDGPWLVFDIGPIDDSLPSLIFPPPIECDSLVLPMGVGRLVAKPLAERLFLWPFSRLTMRWFGGLAGSEGWLAVLSDGLADAGVHATQLAASPGWLRSMGRWQGGRQVRYRFLRGGYVELARAFRQWAEGRGLIRPLRDKLADLPGAEALVGGPMISIYQARPVRRDSYEARGAFVPPEVEQAHGSVRVGVTFAQALQIVRQAREHGMERGVVNVRGWIPGGYDNSHPDVWPPEPALGTLEEFKALMAQEPSVLCVLHDNYLDMYAQSPSFPQGIVATSQGKPLPAGVWAGGQAWVVCPQVALQYARRNWERMKVLRPGGIFLDTAACQNLFECYHPEHLVSRPDDMRLKEELFDFFAGQGLVVGSEEVSDFASPHVCWFENRHAHQPGQSVPLWPLVFHDCNVCYRYCDPAGPDPSGQGAPNWLADMLWGYAPLWALRDVEQWQKHLPAFEALKGVYAWQGRVALERMLEHRFLSEDCLVEQVVFSPGASIICNFSAEERKVEGRLIPARGYVVEG